MKWHLNQIHLLQSLSLTAAFLRSHRRSLAALALLVAIAVLIAAWTVKRRAEREFEAARALSEERAFAPFEKDVRRATGGAGVRLIQSSGGARGLARLNGSVFAATGAGLVEYGEDGRMKRRYTTLDGLPESDLTSIAVFNSKLFIGSRSQGLIVFDGKRFERYRWIDRDAQAVTVLLENRGRLLVGTFAGGLLEFDGGRFREIKISAASGSERDLSDRLIDKTSLAAARGTDHRGAESDQEGQSRVAGINCLIADGARLFIGTFADGLRINDSAAGGGWSHFTIADGLPSNRVVGVVVNGDQLIVASDFGVAAADVNQILNNSDSSQ